MSIHIHRLILVLLLLVVGGTAAAQEVTQSPEYPDLIFLDYGSIGEDYAEIELDIEAGYLSVTFYVRAADPDGEIALVSIIDLETDEELFFVDEPENSEIQFSFDPIANGELSVNFPQAPQYPLEPGQYLFTFDVIDSTLDTITAIIRTGDASGPQAVDFNVWFVAEDTPLTSAAAQADFVDTMHTEIDHILNQQSLQVGEINFVNDPGALGDLTYAGEEDLGTICQAMADAVGVDRAVNLVVINGIASEDGETYDDTAGIANSAGVHGALFEPDSAYSCVVVAWDIHEGDYVDMANTFIHEGAHFMSLPHTTEEDGQYFDLFDDTPECPADEYDADGDGFVDDFECDIEGGANNFIFYSGVPEFMPYVITADQAWVLRRSPLFYPAGD